MIDCPRCGTSANENASECASCGQKFVVKPAGPVEGGGELLRNYFRDLSQILTQPTRFFRRMPTSGGVGGPLAFALVTHWIGSAFGYLWRLLVGGALAGWLSGFFRIAGDVADVDDPGRGSQLLEMRNRIVQWLWGAGPVIADPFLTLASILFTSFLVFVGAKLLVHAGRDGSPREITFESALRIVCFGMSPAILAALPLFGSVVSSICVLVVTVIGAREVYRISTGRAVIVGLFPKVLFIGIIFLGTIFFAVAILKLLVSAF
ncbi:MAG: YIP1 family protein [Bdellovibrionota bacterium]